MRTADCIRGTQVSGYHPLDVAESGYFDRFPACGADLITVLDVDSGFLRNLTVLDQPPEDTGLYRRRVEGSVYGFMVARTFALQQPGKPKSELEPVLEPEPVYVVNRSGDPDATPWSSCVDICFDKSLNERDRIEELYTHRIGDGPLLLELEQNYLRLTPGSMPNYSAGLLGDLRRDIPKADYNDEEVVLSVKRASMNSFLRQVIAEAWKGSTRTLTDLGGRYEALRESGIEPFTTAEIVDMHRDVVRLARERAKRWYGTAALHETVKRDMAQG
jgi:hypothetical protein